MYSEEWLNGKFEVSTDREQLPASFNLTHCEHWRGHKNSMNADKVHTAGASMVFWSTRRYLHSTASLAVKEQLQTEITTRGLLCNPNAFCWPDLPAGTLELLRGSISYTLWNPGHILLFSILQLLSTAASPNNVAMHCHVIHFNKIKLQSQSQTMQLHSPPSPAKSNNEIIAIEHPYLAKSHLQTEAETNTYHNKLLHPVKPTTAAQSSLNPITHLYLLSSFSHPTQPNNTG